MIYACEDCGHLYYRLEGKKMATIGFHVSLITNEKRRIYDEKVTFVNDVSCFST